MVLTFVETTPLDTGSPTRGWRTTALKLAASDRVLSLRELLTLLAIGCVERNPGPPDELEPFYTSTQPLKVWLDSANFVYKIKAYQRGYEWRDAQVRRLLEDLQKLFSKQHKYIKLSEVFVFQEPERDKSKFAAALNSPEWYTDCQREVEVVDGQQRITTFVLLYAVILNRLENIIDGLTEGKNIEDANEKCTELKKRFADKRGTLIIDRDVLFDENSNFWEKVKFDDIKTMGSYLEDSSEDKNSSEDTREFKNAVMMHKWINEEIDKERGEEGDGEEGLEEERSRQLDCLMKLLRVLDEKVYWSTSLTTSASLALTTFVGYNIAECRVPLHQKDIIKVAIVSNIRDDVAEASRDRKKILRVSLTHWKGAEQRLKEVITHYENDDKPNNKPNNLPFASLVTKDTIGHTVEEDRDSMTALLMVDLLKFLRKILVCDDSERASKLPYLEKVSLEEFYGCLRAEDITADNEEGWMDRGKPDMFMKKIREYADALAFIFSRSHKVKQRLIVQNLLAFPAEYQDWRALGIAVIQSLNSKKYEGTIKALGAIELLVTCFAALDCDLEKKKVKPIKEDVYKELIKWVLQHKTKTQNNSAKLCEGLKDKVVKTLKHHLKDRLPEAGNSSLEIYALKQLYFAKDLKKSDIGRALLLMIEHFLPWEGEHENNVKVRSDYSSDKELTVDHILPQNPKSKDMVDWDVKFPDGKQKNVLHRLGNLSLLIRSGNNQAYNLCWPEKRAKLRDKKFYSGLELTKELYTDEKYECWRWEEFIMRHNELFDKLAEKFGVDNTEWKKHVHEWEKRLEEQCKSDEPIASNLKWSNNPASLKNILGNQLPVYLEALREIIRKENKEDVLTHMRTEYPNLNLDLDEIDKARRNFDLMYAGEKCIFRNLEEETRVHLKEKEKEYSKVYTPAGEEVRTQAEELRKTMLEYCIKRDYPKGYAILEKSGLKIIEDRLKIKKKRKHDGTTAMTENNKKNNEALVEMLQETIQYSAPTKQSEDILTHTQCIEKLVAALLDQGIDALNKSKGVVEMMKLLKPSVKASGSKHNKWTYVIPQGFGDGPKTHEGAPTLANNLVEWLRNGFGEKHGFSAADYWQSNSDAEEDSDPKSKRKRVE